MEKSILTPTTDGHVRTDAQLWALERRYRDAGNEAAALHVHGARVLLEKARRMAANPRLAAYATN